MDDMTEPTFEEYQDLIPGGSYPVAGLRLVCIMTPDGEQAIAFQEDGKMATMTWIGALEFLKHDLLENDAAAQEAE